MLWKYYKNIVNVTLFLKFLRRFRQQFFFPPIFNNDIVIIPFKFFSIFSNASATITKKNFLFFPISTIGLPQSLFLTHRTQNGQEFGQRNSSSFSLHLFLFLSLIYVEFRQILSLSSIPQFEVLPKFFHFLQFPN